MPGELALMGLQINGLGIGGLGGAAPHYGTTFVLAKKPVVDWFELSPRIS